MTSERVYNEARRSRRFRIDPKDKLSVVSKLKRRECRAP
jgi:hypothetical protein